MKKYCWLLILPLLATSCVNENEEIKKDREFTGNDILDCNVVETISQSASDDGQTKVSLTQDNLPIWTVGDAISVFGLDSGTNNEFRLTDGADTQQGTFKGSLPASSSYVALYPYSEGNYVVSDAVHFKTLKEQKGAANNIAQDANVMVGTFTDQSMAVSFKNVFGILELKLEGNAKVKKVTLASKADEMLWGDFSLSINGNEGTDNQTLSISNGDNETSIYFENPIQLTIGVPQTVYFILPAGTLGSGFSIHIFDDKDAELCSKSTTRSQTITRSRIRLMETIDDIISSSKEEARPQPFTWAAYNNHARTGTSDQTVIDPQTSGYPAKKENKYVGIFYFLWMNSNEGFNGSDGTYNIQEMLNNQCGPNYYDYFKDSGEYRDFYGDERVSHHWGQPYLDYYLIDDDWVIRKHAQMLVDAGVDFIAFDVTNLLMYPAEVRIICDTYLAMRQEGNKTPQITFLFAHSSEGNFWQLAGFYEDPKYSDLWFRWDDGKPLLLADKNLLNNPDYSYRKSWYLWNTSWQTQEDAWDPWWGDGEDKWPWGCCYTADTPEDGQKAGRHNGINECASVSPATHPSSNIGRSFEVGNNWQTTRERAGVVYPNKAPEKGIYFKQQFTAANALDPKVMFFTGWNEWIAQRWYGGALEFCCMGGQEIGNDNALFVDQYNYEFSRDIEPLNGGFGDNYYYYMVDFIRRFKGVDATPVYSKQKEIEIDGYFADWNKVESIYADDKGDTFHRKNQTGWAGRMFNNSTGRNDLQYSQVATDGINLYFYVEATDNLSNYANGETGLNLYIKAGSLSNSWEGFNYRLMPTGATTAALFRSNGGWSWTKVSDISLAVNGKALEASIPLSSLGIGNANDFNIDFKWVDNVDLSQTDGIQRCMRDGDSAPNGRFRYRYVFKK